MLITSWDDYSKYNYKLADLLIQYNIPTIFYIEIEPHRDGNRDQAIYQIKKLVRKGFEIGAHSWTHPADMKLLDDEQIHKEIKENRTFLHSITGQEIDSFCYPRGRYNDNVIQAVKDAGYKYARTTKIGDCTVDDNPFEMKTSCHVYNRKEYDGLSWLEYAKNNYKHDEFFHLWGHAWEIEDNNEWDNLKIFFEFVKSL